MRTILTYIPLLLLLLTIVGTSCRRPLEDELHLTAKIPFTVYWDSAGITAQNATAMAYREDGTLYKETMVAGSPDQTFAEGYIELEAGVYTIIIFNELRNQIDYVNMRGHQHLSTFEAFVTPVSSFIRAGSYVAGETLVNQPGPLAVWKGVLTVTPEMISRSREAQVAKAGSANHSVLDAQIQQLTEVHPPLKTVRTHIRAHIKGLHNARMPALTELRNMAQGYFMGTDQNNTTPVTVQFMMNNRQYDPGSYTEGTINESVSTFGLIGDRTSLSAPRPAIYTDLVFQLVDINRTVVTRSVDVSRMITVDANTSRILLDVFIDMQDPLPYVTPENSGGMNAEVAEWDGEEIFIDMGS